MNSINGNNIKHIHEVLFLFQEKEFFKNEEELQKEIITIFGENAKFTSCSNIPFGIDGVVPFLLEREKIVINDNGNLALHPSMTMCNGHENDEKHHHQY